MHPEGVFHGTALLQAATISQVVTHSAPRVFLCSASAEKCSPSSCWVPCNAWWQ